MKTGLIAFLLLTTGLIGLDLPQAFPPDVPDKVLKKKPEFFILDWKSGTTLFKKKTDITIEVYDSSNAPVVALVNQIGNPVLYTSDIATPVCADGECKLMHIQMYWTLLGDYAGFDRYPKLPLTKHDHDEFLKEDYMKLHQLLTDHNSVLGRRKIDQLVIKPKEPKIEGADGASGATIAAVKESVVDGALYSCYIAWHLAHGEIKNQLKDYTIALLTDEMVVDMLDSDNPEYQMFALKKFSQPQYEQYHLRIAEIFKTAIPLVRTFIIKNLSESFWEDPQFQQRFWDSFSQVDINSRSLLLEHLDQAPKTIVNDLSSHLSAMSKNQLKIYLQQVSERGQVDQTTLNNLKDFASSKSQPYGYLAEQYLEELEY